MFFRARATGEDPWLASKLWLFGAGAALGVVGMFLRSDLMVVAAGFVLVAGLLLRFLPSRARPRE